MAVKKITTVFQFRRDTTENWLLNGDKAPHAGEPCFDLDLHTLRIGDGTTPYKDLPVIGGVDVKVSADEKSITLEDGVFKLLNFDEADVGAQPRKNADGNIEWVIPAEVDVEEMQTTINNLETNVTNLTENVTNIQEILAPSEEGAPTLLNRVEGLEAKVDAIGDVDAKIQSKIDAFAALTTPNDDKVNTLMELIDYVEKHDKTALEMVVDIDNLQALVGSTSVQDQIREVVNASGHMAEEKANAMYEHVKYEITDTPVGTLVNYGDKEIRVMVPSGAEFVKQAVGAGGNANAYYMTFKTYAPSDDVVGYIEHLGDQVDAQILTDFSTDKYGRRYQPTWLALATYDEATDTWSYKGAKSTVNGYVGYDYQIDWYDANGVMVASDCVRINLSNEDCHNNVEPYYMANVVKAVAVNGTVMDIVNGRVDITFEEAITVKGSDEIDVAADGTLSIKQISIDKIIQGEEEEIILDGGGAA